MKLKLSYIVYLIVIFMISFPYTRVVLPVFGDVNIKSWLLLIIFIILLIRSCFSSKKINNNCPYPIQFLFLIFSIYFFWSIIFGRDFKLVTSQIYEFTPFLIACLMLSNKLYLKYHQISDGIIYAVAISGGMAAYIFYFNIDLLPLNAATGMEFLDADFAWGRLPWRSGPNVILCLIIYLFRPDGKKNNIPITLAMIICLIAEILTFSRTCLIAIIIIFFVSLFFSYKNKYLTKILIFYFMAFFAVYISVGIFNFENVIDNIRSRIIGFLTLSSEYDISGHISDRTILYAQYFDVFLRSPILGVGFGVPYSTVPEFSTYSDITIISFLLPLGLIGLYLFLIFIKKLWLLLTLAKDPIYSNTVFGLKMSIIIGLTISLNDDIWSHKEFIIIITMLVTSIYNSKSCKYMRV